MNVLETALADFCDDHRIEEKVLVAPSLSAGHQMAQSIVRAGRPWINLRVEMIRSLAHGLVSADIAAEGKSVLSRAQALAMVEQACSEVLSTESYLGRLLGRPGLYTAVQDTLGEIRGAGIAAEDLPDSAFEDPGKAAEIRAIAKAYESALLENNLVDGHDILRRATVYLKESPAKCGKSWYLIPADMDLPDTEAEFLGLLSGGRLKSLPVDSPAGWHTTKSSVQNFQALGEENEVREVFRSALTGRIPLDDIEIIYTDPGTYLPLIYEMASHYNVPSTFAEGVSVAFSRPGQAVLGFLGWFGGGFAAEDLRRLLAVGCIDLSSVSKGSDPPGALSASRVVREAGIGWGKSRYVTCLDAVMERCESRLLKASGEEDEPESSGSIAWHERRLQAALAVRKLVEQFFNILPEPDEDDTVDFGRLAEAGKAFLTQFASVQSDADGVAVKALAALFGDFVVLPTSRLKVAQAVHRMTEAVKQAYILSATPRPGHLHVSSIANAGYSGRSNSFLIGLDESRYPGTDIQDPILLDDERSRINEDNNPHRLRLRFERPAEKKDAAHACLARIRGSVTLGFSCRNLLEDRGQFPSSLMLEAYRLTNGKPEADYSELTSSLGSPAGFISTGECIDETEWWLGQIGAIGRNGDGIAAEVRAAHPWLEDGRKAEDARRLDELNQYEGYVPSGSSVLDPRETGAPVSSSTIEGIARCPFRHFLTKALGVEPPDDLRRDPFKWLDPMEFGSLLHDVFCEFVKTLVEKGEKPLYSKHLNILNEAALRHIADWRQQIPPPNEPAFAQRRDEILEACRIFLIREEEHCRHVTPFWCEVEFGSDEPLVLSLGGGRQLHVRGRIDRVDRRDDGDWEVWDYKTGSARWIKEESQFSQGRQVQFAVYAAATNNLLSIAGQSGEVVKSGYFFPGPKGEGQRIVMKPDSDALAAVLNDIFDLVAAGVFPATHDSGVCTYCDYTSVCGGEMAAIRSKSRCDGPGNPLLDPFRRLKGR